MSPLSRPRLALLGALMAAVGWAITRMLVSAGRSPLPVPWTVLVVSVGAAVLALVLGWSVRQYRKGKNPGLTGLRAARTVVYAHACAYSGAIVGGAYAGYGLALALDWGHLPRREVAISALVAALGGLALVVAGLIAEHWCRDDEQRDKGGAPA
ncbi:DUF3180 domain-containing protein [Demequina sp.]|uniref:DUF3180 domain-containing protein n=1 Tax=Demequina sp. TaxID=2050685 RepID=UPI0025ED4104|nr:DUF3180 domain-containing protein [Demequina sp.]